MERPMRFLISVAMCVGAAAAAQAGPVSSTAAALRGPAPEIGSGIPVVLAIGGVLLATRLFTRWRRS
jgi:hypothetical protein